MVARPSPKAPRYVINLSSSRRPPGVADQPKVEPGPGKKFFYTEVVIDQKTWHRLRLGYFDSSGAASDALATLRETYPTAWIDRADEEMATLPVADRDDTDGPLPIAEPEPGPVPAMDVTTAGTTGEERLEALMHSAHRAMTAGEISKAVQIYTKILQQPPNPFQQDAQEYLALARERNGQLAHAKAEYKRYLAMYPESEGADRVSQRLSTLLSRSGQRNTGPIRTDATDSRSERRASAWNLRTFFSQYYRHDVNQINDNEEVISQSSLYSDINVDARRRGERFDFSTRLTAGYRTDFLDETSGSGNDLRLSYAYADLADTRSGLRGRVGRQSRNTGGVLGRFDGFNLSYQATERLRVDAVAGKPVFSTADSVDDSRTFYGISSNFGPIGDNLEVGAFYLQQEIENVTDRQAVGGELRYFAENKSVWGLVHYDLAFEEVGSMFLQGSWRLPSLFTITGLVDHRRSPFLSTGNALIGQTTLTFAELTTILSEEELRRLALDRTASTTTVTLGLSRALTPRLQFNLNASEAAIEATPESGGVAATPQTTYHYYSTDLVASSLVAQGDVSIFGLRYADSNSTEIWSLNLDTRFPIGRSFRLNPRIRVDHRLIKSDLSEEWIYTPGLRMQYRWGRRLRLEFQAGKQFANRKLVDSDLSRESYFINFGYQFFY
jgi:tetratricopeptide (TPR) repeat protein